MDSPFFEAQVFLVPGFSGDERDRELAMRA